MKLDITKTMSAPFTTLGESSLTSIYLIAFAFSFGAFLVQLASNISFQFIEVMGKGIGDSAFSTGVIALAIIIALISFVAFIAVYAIPSGYIIETAKLEVYNRSAIMPSWTGNYGRFFWNGLKAIGIYVIYTIIMFAIIAIPTILIAALGGFAGASGSDIAGAGMGLAVILYMIFFFLIMFGFMIFVPMAIVRFAAEGKFWSAFNILAILQKIFGNILDFSLAIIFIILLIIILTIVVIGLVCTCVGILLVPLVQSFIFPIMALNLFAQVYKD
jgi:hypothetical protein